MSSGKSEKRVRLTADERRVQIDDAARAIALESGLIALTTRALAARAGIAKGLVAYYEPSMDALRSRTFTEIVVDEREDVRAVIADVAPGAAALTTAIRTLLVSARSDVTQLWMEAWVLGGRSELLAAAARAQMDEWEGFLTGILRALELDREAGELPALSRQIFGMIDGLNAHALVHWHTDENRVATLFRSVEAVLGLPSDSLVRLDR